MHQLALNIQVQCFVMDLKEKLPQLAALLVVNLVVVILSAR